MASPSQLGLLSKICLGVAVAIGGPGYLNQSQGVCPCFGKITLKIQIGILDMFL